MAISYTHWLAALSNLAAHLKQPRTLFEAGCSRKQYGNNERIKRDEVFNYEGAGSSSADQQGTGVVLGAIATQARAHRSGASPQIGWGDCSLSPDTI